MERYMQWSTDLQERLQMVLLEVCGKQWGYEKLDNSGLYMDIRNEFDKMEERQDHRLELLGNAHTDQGLQIFLKPEATITTLYEVTQCVHQILLGIHETCLIILPLLDDETLRYWFAIGALSHGHIGAFLIQRHDIAHLDLSTLP